MGEVSISKWGNNKNEYLRCTQEKASSLMWLDHLLPLSFPRHSVVLAAWGQTGWAQILTPQLGTQYGLDT